MKFRVICGLAAFAVALAACGNTSTNTGTTGQQPPTATMKPLDKIGAGEGQLNLIAWEGYTDDSWVKDFQNQSHCQVNAKYAGSSDEMVSLMTDGGGGQWDMVSASGDADLRLIYGGDVRPMNEKLIPDFTNFEPYFQTPPYNTINGVHYGISLQWGPNVLLYNTNKFKVAPTSWSSVYDPSNKGIVTAYDYPITIADGALYLMKSQPSLGIKDPYELTKKQFDATVQLLTSQRQLINKYWGLASDEISLFQNGDVQIGAAWPYQTGQLKAAGAPVAETIPSEGATGWGDTWMLATKAPHPNCAYMWTVYVSTAHVQALQALFYGETPVNTKACAEMESMQAGSCHQYHADASAQYFSTIKFWKTPETTCDDGSQNCIPYDQWVSAWTAIKG
ncbi:MAG TPA: ABC transporter substrate-binding protein [Candidatus Dormibacteraeota bacterium]|nr:ABC transporter substrate-binding protein [Candidatus Dormibacteraeota bacterium]HEX2680596.1 ABC transporter substrate-binding protein [Candidatus Dormibacteraeota bacterium]